MQLKKYLNRVLPAVILLTAWAISMWYATAAGARALYTDWQRMSWSFHEVSCYNETQRILGETELEDAYMAYLELPLVKSMWKEYANPANHLEISHYFLDQEGKSTVPEGRYAVIRYYQQKEWLSQGENSTRYESYIDLGGTPPEFENWLAERMALVSSEQSAPRLELQGRFEGERFVPVQARWVEEFVTVNQYTQWYVIFDRSNGEPQPETLMLQATTDYDWRDASVVIVDTTTEPASVGELSFDNCQALAEAWAEPTEALIDAYNGYDWTSKPSFRDLRSMVFIRETCDLQPYGASDEDDVNFVRCTQILRCAPLRSAMIQLIPVYIVSLAAVLLTFWLVRRCYSKSILEALNCGDGRGAERMWGSHGWQELARLEEKYEEAAGLLQKQTPELRRMEAALRYAGDAEKNRRKLVSDMTHELKTPLAVIHSYAEGLSMGIAAEKQETYLKVIMEEAEKMDKMVLSMLDLSRLEAGRVHLNWETVCLMDMAKEVFEKLKPFYEEKNLTVHFLGETFDVLADRNRMEQLITNLATNAVKYCTPAGSILVKVHQLEDQTWFSMENDCYRLPQKALDQIWDSFFREDSARGTKGTGLGLAIVKSIVELHNGSCRAVNTDSGLELQITLPR